MKTIILYTDGACSGNPGPGGWGAILDDMGRKTELSGGEANTTNNRMELTAVIMGLQALDGPHSVELFSDSKYVIDALKLGWAASWRSKGWRKSDGKPAQNADLWEVLLDLVAQHEMTYHWVKGHADNPMNNRCDELAVAEWQRIKAGESANAQHAVQYDTVDMTSFAVQLNMTIIEDYRKEISGGLDKLVEFALNHDMLNDQNARQVIIEQAKKLGICMDKYCPVCGEKIRD